MTREPIRLRPTKYTGQMTVEALTAWFEQLLADQARVHVTNVLAALEAGEIDDIDNAEGVIDEAQHMADEARVKFQRILAALAAQP